MALARGLRIPSRRFHACGTSLSAKIVHGNKVAEKIRREALEKISAHQGKTPDFQPKLTIIQVGVRPDSSAYVRMKLKASKDSGVDCHVIKLPEDIAEQSVLNEIERLNNDPKTHGVLVQLPLPKHMDEARITNAVLTEKDVDGFGRYNAGELAKRAGTPLFIPCTPAGVMKLLEESQVNLRGKMAVVVGRSDIVGTPVAALLRNKDATVVVTHSHTKNLDDLLKMADVVVAACGVPQFIKGHSLKQGAVVIDVGINYVADSSKKSGYKLVGDVDKESVEKVAGYLTPVPGGVGPMTVAMLVDNVVKSAELQEKRFNRSAKVTPLSLELKTPVPSDIEISRSQTPRSVEAVAQEIGVLDSELELFGHYKAKVSLDVMDRLKHRNNAKYVLVAGITPTPLGEGKSTTTMGLVQALGAHLGLAAFANVRQPSMGPTFGVKGGAAGGGYAQVIPMDEFNMHVTGDIHAVGAANNLVAAALETRMFHESTQTTEGLYKRLVPTKKGVRKFTPSMKRRLAKLKIDKEDPDSLTKEEAARFARLDIDPSTITIKRVLDVNDRHLREVTVGQAPTEKGLSRKTGFDITVASEFMAILALSSDLSDLRKRAGAVVVGADRSGNPVTAEDLGVGGAAAALLKDAIKPTLMQTLEGTPVFVHAGPFANISIGASSVIADRIALKLAGSSSSDSSTGFVVTEAGFDFAMGGERFMNIKCRSSGLHPDVIVIVATVRALKLHGGAPEVKPGQQLPSEYTTENVDLVRKGCLHLAKQISNASQYGSPVVVAINQFVTDSPEELSVVREMALEAGATDAVKSNHWAEGGKGAIDLAHAVARASEVAPSPKLLYSLEDSIEDKLCSIVKNMYGGANIQLSDLAKSQIESYKAQGFGHLPVCIAKTQYSLSHDPKLKGVPTGFTVPIREVRISAGAGYLYALAAEIMTIPGLATHAGFMNVELNEKGEIEGLF